ncbi:MAG: Eco57I restriction-modification methylase domain-containing protein [Acidimicrobiales bacterium]
MATIDTGDAPGADYGEVFTRPWVVDFILDLVGYTADRDLGSLVLVEPSCGTGAFLGPIVDRLVDSAGRYGRPLDSLGGAIRAYDLLDANATLARKAAALRLQEAGVGLVAADGLSSAWVTTADFLLHPHEQASADVVVGNPPYLRLESVADDRMRAYRSRCPTMRGRADVYVGFFEMGLSLLREGGVLGFICADRWMRNQYGAELRRLVSSRYAVDTVVSMHDVDAFEADVSAYPAVVVLRNQAQEATTIVDARAGFDGSAAVEVSAWASGSRAKVANGAAYEASRVDQWFEGRDLWPTGTPSQLALIADLERRFPPLEDPRTGTRVGIGVATGCDDVYITTDPTLVEPGRLLPLLRANDIVSGQVDWSGSYLVNPWGHDGLVDLDAFPRLKGHLQGHADRLRGRHVARRRPEQWYRTIDRVNPSLQDRPKLMLPDMKARAHPVFDEGRFYPHHNLYSVVSDAWDLEVLGGILLSDVANLFVGAYCVRMRGGCYRFQAQYLRRIRVPAIDSIGCVEARALVDAFRARDVEAATSVARRIYGVQAQKLA